MTVALVSTVRNPGPSIGSFVRHHLDRGVATIYLVFDDPEDPWMASVPPDDRVQVLPCDDDLRACWADWPEMRGMTADHVMARQVLNAELVLQLARSAGSSWLIHLDADELLAPVDGTIHGFLAGLGPEVDHVTFLNLEVVPETEDIGDYFREMTLFKRSPYLLPEPRTVSQRALIERLPQLPARWFFYYTIGKSAVRVRPGVRPDGVHRFRHPDRSSRAVVVAAPRVLHYMNAGFENFWRRYQTWGQFPDRWFGGERISDRIGGFHLDARDVVATGDRAAARQFYRERVVIDNPATIAALIESGLCERIDPWASGAARPPGMQ